MSLESTQNQLQGLIQQTEKHSEVAETIRTCLEEIDLCDCSPDRCLNLVHCLAELKDDSLYDSVRKFLNPHQYPETELTPVQCSALADLMLMSTTPIEEFDLTKYTTKEKAMISSALRSPQSPLTELDLTKNRLGGNAFEIFIEGLKNAECKLEAFSLSLSGIGLSEESPKNLASALKPMISNLRELELSENILMDSLLTVIADGLRCRKLEKLRSIHNKLTAEGCETLASALSSRPSPLRELDLSYNDLHDTGVMKLCKALTKPNCTLEKLRFVLKKVQLNVDNIHGYTSAELFQTVILFLRFCWLWWPLFESSLTGKRVMRDGEDMRQMLPGRESNLLSFCKVKEDGCSSLASALMSDHCCLRELDLSFNHLTDHGAKMLSEKQRDPHCRLECLKYFREEKQMRLVKTEKASTWIRLFLLL
uniref:NACHT LRR and PYD domain-containing protein n=1 Tax=Poecilia latipinna TaxID=48699 RepID=A0A3B3UFY3_9TELE